jgi:hypothetical protein
MTRYSKISVLVPTRGRSSQLAKMLRSYEATTLGELGTSELIFRVDEDDYTTRQMLLGQNVIVKPRVGYAGMTQMFNEMAAVASGNILMVGNDDMVFQTLRWPTLLINVADHFPDGVFILGTKTHNEGHFPFCVVSKRFYDIMGFYWDPAIYWGDVYLRDIMLHFGRAVMVPQVQIDHEWIGFAPDQTFLEGNQNDIYRRDPTYWQTTHAPAVARAIAKLQPLLQEVTV